MCNIENWLQIFAFIRKNHATFPIFIEFIFLLSKILWKQKHIKFFKEISFLWEKHFFAQLYFYLYVTVLILLLCSLLETDKELLYFFFNLSRVYNCVNYCNKHSIYLCTKFISLLVCVYRYVYIQDVSQTSSHTLIACSR